MISSRRSAHARSPRRSPAGGQPASSKKSSIRIRRSSAPSTSPLLTDEPKLSQILRNLISNALKFTECGEVRVSAGPPAADGTIMFTVADTGIGIAREDQERIFDELMQLEHGLQRRVRGTGLGLPLARPLAGLLGGTLTVSSEPGVGSTFTLVLPMRYAVPQPETGSFEWAPDPGRLPLLVVDDAPDAQYVYEKVLRHSAFQIYPAYSAREAELALERIAPAAVLLDTDRPDVILLDLVMPDTPGEAILERLRADAATRQIPVVIVTSKALDATAREQLLHGTAAIFSKSEISRGTLGAVVRAAAGRHLADAPRR